MKKFIISVSLVLAFFSQDCLAGTPNMADFPYERVIITPNSQLEKNNEVVKIDLEKDVLKKINAKFSNFDIFNNKNEEVPFSLFLKNAGPIEAPKIIAVSSQFEQSNPNSLVDDNIFTEYIFNEKADKTEASWVLLDLGRKMSINRIKTFIPDGTSVQSVELWGGNTTEDLRKLMKKRLFEQQLDLSTKFVRYVKVMYWGGNAETNIKISDIKLYADTYGIVFFKAKPGERYKAVYGGPEVNLIRYEQRFGNEPTNIDKIAFLGRETTNSLFSVDYDEDGINNAEDNCPFISNSEQLDSDNDRVGDSCDNAPKKKNFTQSDIDRDGVGDVSDNCRITKNADQLNKDGDEYGDACDLLKNEKTDAPSDKDFSISEGGISGKMLALGGIFILILFVAILVKSKKKR